MDINLEKENRNGYYDIIDDQIEINGIKVNGKLYKVVLGAGYGMQETFNLYKDDKGKWVNNLLYETVPLLYDSIRAEIDKLER